jgi:hypothetical protein
MARRRLRRSDQRRMEGRSSNVVRSGRTRRCPLSAGRGPLSTPTIVPKGLRP